MPEPPYDRALALAAQVRTMRDHYLEVICGCGARRVIGLGVMAKDPRFATATLAHVALKIGCDACTGGPTEVHLTATIYGTQAPEYGGGPLYGRSRWCRGLREALIRCVASRGASLDPLASPLAARHKTASMHI